MKLRSLLLVLPLLLGAGRFLRADDAAVPGDRKGIVCISDQPFPVPAGSEVIALPGGDFETGGTPPPGWNISDGQVVTAPDAPQGKSYFQMKAVLTAALRSPTVDATGGRAYFVSFWLKQNASHWAALTFTAPGRQPSATAEPIATPATGGKWKRIGLYFWMPGQEKTIQFHLVLRRETPDPNELISVDDVQLRSATDEEMSDAYAAEQSHFPPFDTSPLPGYGGNLALSVAKWEGKAGIPGKPFVIWGVGSSWTEAQKNGYGLIRAIRLAFPNAPQIIYQEHDGAGTPWDYVASWVKQWIAADQPDLVFSYTPGSTDGLNRMLNEIRKRTTADIIIPSIHFGVTSKLDQNDIDNGYAPWAQVQQICGQHHAEFVSHRTDLVPYMKANNILPDDLLWDHTHQNLEGMILVWDSVQKHITDPKQFTYSPDALERSVPVSPPAATATEQVTLDSNWTANGGSVQASQAGAKITVHFTGNRIDLLGHKLAGGGSVKVTIDGTPADQAPVFFSDIIKATPKVYPKKNVGGQPGDVAPQGVDLLANLVPQSWTITMTSDTGDYQIVGSVTGPDGTGNVAQPFTSKSGQIGIEPIDWRNGVLKPQPNAPPGPIQYGNVTGDQFDFDVYRCAVGQVSFAGDAGTAFSVPLVENLPNTTHTLEITAGGDGGVQIDSFYVFTPMEK